MTAWIRWTSLVLIGGCCHLGGHGTEEDREEDDLAAFGCEEADSTHGGHDGHEDRDPCDAGREP